MESKKEQSKLTTLKESISYIYKEALYKLGIKERPAIQYQPNNFIDGIEVKDASELPYYSVKKMVENLTPTSFYLQLSQSLPTHEDIKSIIEASNTLISQENFYQEKNLDIIHNIYNDCEKLHKSLEPLSQVGVAYSMNIMGGAVRDLVLGNAANIKDLDILIAFDQVDKPIDVYYNDQDMLIEHDVFSKEELERVAYSDNEHTYLKKCKLLKICLERHYAIENSKLMEYRERVVSKNWYGEDIMKELCGIIQLDKKDFSYPVEILLTQNNMVAFVNNIDFGICQAGIALFSNLKGHYGYFTDMKQAVSFLKEEDLHKRFFASSDFFKDVSKKTLTYNENNVSSDQIEYSFTNHLIRLAQKYPDYKIALPDVKNEEIKKSLERAYLNYQLLTSLEEKKENKVPRRKI